MALSQSKKSGSQTPRGSALLAKAFQEVSKLSGKRQDAIAVQILDIVRDKPDPVVKRFQDLVEYKYTRGLTPDEVVELSRLEAGFEKSDEEFYAPILARVRRLSNR